MCLLTSERMVHAQFQMHTYTYYLCVYNHCCSASNPLKLCTHATHTTKTDGAGFDSDETRDLLVCFAYIVKNTDRSVLTHWWNMQGVHIVFIETLVLSLQVSV